jgi:hypothetical protein
VKKVEKVAVVELGGSHDECLLSQFYALKSRECYILFVTTQEVYDRNSSFHSLIDELKIIHFKKRAWIDFVQMSRLNSVFKKEGYSKVILNTAQGAHIRNLCLSAPKSTEFIGIVHTLKKFEGSFTQKLIHRKIKKYFVLNDYFLERIVPSRGIAVTSFYPLRFPHFNTTIEKAAGEKWITIIGGVENRRKDLTGSISLMKSLIEKGFRFIFLGKSDFSHPDVIAFNSYLKGTGIEQQVQLFDAFVSAETFDAYLKETDFIWPMVHPNTPSAAEYFKNQISGAMNVSFGYKIPMFIHQEYAQKWKDFQFAIPYALDNFTMQVLKANDEQFILQEKLKSAEKFNPLYQEKKYLDFIFNSH